MLDVLAIRKIYEFSELFWLSTTVTEYPQMENTNPTSTPWTRYGTSAPRTGKR
jgi:hypothetical protein